MSLLAGRVSVARFDLIIKAPAFDDEGFREIPRGDEINRSRSHGFVPMVSGAEYQTGTKSYAGRVRFDEVRPDPVAVNDLFGDFLLEEKEPPGKAGRKELRELAWAEIAASTPAARKYVEWVLVDDRLYISTTSRPVNSSVLGLFRRLGATNLEPVTPWRDLPDMCCEAVEVKHPGQSRWGPRYLRALTSTATSERRMDFEDGCVALEGVAAKHRATGKVFDEVSRMLDAGFEITSANLKGVCGQALKLDALSWWVSGISLGEAGDGHWTDVLGKRMESLGEILDALDASFEELRPEIEAAAKPGGRAWIQESLPTGPRLVKAA